MLIFISNWFKIIIVLIFWHLKFAAYLVGTYF